MSAIYHRELEQGTEEWLQARVGLLTASEMHLAITPTLRPANNDKTRSHVYELLAQRITGHVEPRYVSDDMMRGREDEMDARILYAQKCAPVDECGFVTNSKWGFTIGYSPDGLVGDDGLIEVKSRRQKYQIQTICECVDTQGIPDEYVTQIQTGLLVSERKWCDFMSYSNGLPMVVIRVWPDPRVQAAIIDAAMAFEGLIAAARAKHEAAMASPARLFPTERRIYQDILT